MLSLYDYIRKGLALIVVATGLCAALTGCVTSQPEVKPEIDTTLMISHSGNKATLQWNTRPDMLYTVMYAPRRKGGVQWNPLPSYTRIPGNGTTVTITDIIPRNTTRYYRLHIEALSTSR